MNALYLIIIALFVKVIQSYFSKKNSMILTTLPSISTFIAQQYTFCIIIAIVFIAINQPVFSYSLPTILISAMGGLSLALCGIFYYMALNKGAIVLVSMSSMAGMLIPCFAGIFLFHENFSIIQFGGILLLGVCVKLLTGYNELLKGKIDRITILCLFFVFLCEGTTMLSQKMFTYYQPNADVSAYTFWAFVFAALSMWGYVIYIKKSKKCNFVVPFKKTLPALVVLSLAVFIINMVITKASLTLPSMLLFPMLNGLGLVLVTIMSGLCFKERLTAKSIAGMVVGITSLVIINTF